MNVYLVGYRGTGKSTLAPKLASRLAPGWAAIDMDELIEERAGQTVAEIFQKDGEPAFRDWESRILEELASSDRLVVATGGGVVLRESNRNHLEKGFVVWLTASAATLFSRINEDSLSSSRRPNLTDRGGLGEIEELLAQRLPYYEMVANLVYSTEHSTLDDLADQIAERVIQRESA